MRECLWGAWTTMSMAILATLFVWRSTQAQVYSCIRTLARRPRIYHRIKILLPCDWDNWENRYPRFSEQDVRVCPPRRGKYYDRHGNDVPEITLCWTNAIRNKVVTVIISFRDIRHVYAGPGRKWFTSWHCSKIQETVGDT